MENQQSGLSSALKQEFQKDLELFKHFLLLLNNSGPIRNVELMWNEELDPTKPKFKNRVGTEDALIQLQPGGTNRNSPSTLFCDLVHGFGAHEEETCGRSDVPAQQRCRATGCTQVYPCHVGLTDIAVPVTCGDQYLGTLFSGQVLTQSPTKEGFELVRASLARQPHIDFTSLEAAYYRVPVVSQAQLAEMVRVLELFARYISNSWKRMQIMSEFQRTQDRQLALDRRELASLLLSGEPVAQEELSDLAGRAGLRRLPDRVLVLQVGNVNTDHGSLPQLANQMTVHRLSRAVEDLCQTWTNTIAMAVRPGELCILTAREARNPGHEQISLQEIADAVLAEVHSLGGASARIGISASHPSPIELVRAYQEACAAVESSTSPVKFFNGPSVLKAPSVERLEQLLKTIRRGDPVSGAVREFLAEALPHDSSPSKLQQSRAFLTWAIEHIGLEVATIGADSRGLVTAKQQTLTAVLHAPTSFSACEAFGNFVSAAARQVASTFADREQKIVLSVRQLIEDRGVAQLTIQEIAAALHLSAGHLSRIYRRATGITLEGFLIRQRVELAKRTLLDPRLNVAEVAERCGFCNPAYFAYVFKKYEQCTPREFARRPHLPA